MKIKDMLKYSVRSLSHSKLRTWLTILGIVIGISSIIILVSIGQGLNKFMNEQLSQFGGSTIIVTPVNLQSSGVRFGGQITTSGKLYLKDVSEVEQVSGVELISPVLNQRISVSFKGRNITSTVSGIQPSVYKEVFKDITVGEGRYLIDSDRGSVVLGYDIANTGFGKESVKVNNYISLEEKKYRVIGILKKTGNAFAAVDNGIFITYPDARDLFGDRIHEREVNAIVIKVKDGFPVDEVAANIEEKLRASHGVKEGEEDFGLVTPSFINSTVGSIISMLTVFLGAIAAISLVVGGVGIMNTMFMAVVERIKEIGTLKAIGARQSEILSIFLIESSIIGGVGGVIGIAVAIAIVTVVSNFGIPVYLDPYVVIGAFVFSFAVGLVSGFIPARNAAKVSPLEALRYE